LTPILKFITQPELKNSFQRINSTNLGAKAPTTNLGAKAQNSQHLKAQVP